MPAPLAAIVRALVVWLAIMLAESLHGAIRRVLFSPELDLALRQLSVVFGVVIIFGLTWLFLAWMRIRTARGALAIGALWVLLTLAFELALVRVSGQGWDRFIADYDLRSGGLMPPGLLAMFLTPWAVRRLQAGRPPRRAQPLARDPRRAP
jgi:hypothetical protein